MATGINSEAALSEATPFEAEMRRRLWYQLLLVDTRAAEARGFLPTQPHYDTRCPLNINEEDLSAESKVLPSQRTGVADMTIALVRFRLVQTGKLLQPHPDQVVPIQRKEEIVRELREYMRNTLWQYCDAPNASQRSNFFSIVSKMIVSRMYIMLYQRDSGHEPPEGRDYLFTEAIRVVENSNLQKRHPFNENFEWLFRFSVPWHAIAFLLMELVRRPPGADSDRAWLAIENSRADWDLPSEANNALSRTVRGLFAQAEAHRESQAAIDRLSLREHRPVMEKKQTDVISQSSNLSSSLAASSQMPLDLLHPGFNYPVSMQNSNFSVHRSQQQPQPPVFGVSNTSNFPTVEIPLEYAPASQIQVAPWIFEPPTLYLDQDMMSTASFNDGMWPDPSWVDQHAQPGQSGYRYT